MTGCYDCMNEIKFTGHFGHEKKTVELSQVHGGGGGYHIYIDRFFFGQMLPRPTGWYCTNEEFTKDDIDALIEKIEIHEQQKGA